jgi:hypothetical protein
MDMPTSPVDFAIVFHFNERLNLNALLAGADSARHAFPTTGSHLQGNRWIKHHGPSRDAIASTSCDTATIESFIERPIDLSNEFPVQQLVLTCKNEPKTTLVTRFHHSVADGMSAALWLRHQFEIVYGLRRGESQGPVYDAPHLKSVSSVVRKSRFAYSGPSDRLSTRSVTRSGSRSWETISIDASRIRRSVRAARGFTYSDFLATCALETFARWNRSQGGNTQRAQKIALWLPINVRQRPAEGFGNGTSRIRIYARYPADAPLAEKCREVRRQIEWCTSKGEWVVPDIKALTLLPRSLTGPILRRNLTRPSVDMATGVFSHSDRWNASSNGVFNSLDRIECVGLLHPFHALAINGATHREKTWLTFTYDNGLLTRDDVGQLIGLYREQIESS